MTKGRFSLERKIIIAFRHKFDDESREEYFKSQNRLKVYLVLKEFEDKLLVTDLKSYKSDKLDNFILENKDYDILCSNVVPSKILMIFKENLIDYSDKNISNYEYFNILVHLRSIVNNYYLTLEESQMFYEIYTNYFRNRIKTSSVVTVSVDGDYATYYVTDMKFDGFDGIKLKYSRKKGFEVISTVPSFVSYYSSFDSICNLDKCVKRVKKLVK